MSQCGPLRKEQAADGRWAYVFDAADDWSGRTKTWFLEWTTPPEPEPLPWWRLILGYRWTRVHPLSKGIRYLTEHGAKPM